uniref:Multiprotein-bridging factor 1b n=1 Tax=Aegilops tauschii TaxID=37682 RepID=N1R1S3_AEGTA
MAGIGPIRQDWEPIVVRKKAQNAADKKDEKAVNAARRSGAEIDTTKKYNAGTNKAASSGTSLNTKRLDDDTENLSHLSFISAPVNVASAMHMLRHECVFYCSPIYDVTSRRCLALRLKGEAPPAPCLALPYSLINIDLDDERVSSDLKKNLMQARLDKKMTQAQLAQMINEKPQVIQEYESGKAIPNNQIIGKLERALGAKLRSKK